MSDLNQCQFIGRLGDNPQMRTTQSGDVMATFSIAVSEKWNDKQGNRQEKTEWVNIQAFGRLAEIMGQYLQKGSQVFISGKLQSRKYTGQDGIERTATSILANQMQMLGSRQDGQQPQQYAQQPQNGYQQAPQQGQWGNPPSHYQTGQAPQGYPQAPTITPPQDWQVPQPQQGQQYQTINGPPTTIPVGQPMPVTPPMGQVLSDDSMPF